MDRLIKYNSPSVSVVVPVEYGKGDSVPIDQQSSKDFNVDPLTGRPINDITVVLRSQDKFEQQRILANLEQFKADYLPSDLSNEDALKYSVPRYAQLPSELAELSEKFSKQQVDEFKKAAQAKKAKEDNERFEKLIKKFDNNSD